MSWVCAVRWRAGLFAVSEPLVFYASETKQYSVDLAVALGLLAVATAERRRPGLFAAAGSLAVWFSHPSLFVLGGITLAALLFERRAAGALGVAACWALSFLVEDRLFLRELRNNDYLLRFWSDSFMPLPPRSAADARWFLTTFFDVFKDPVGLPFTGLAAALFLAGVVALAGDGRRTLVLLLTPVALALIASGLRKYPFSTRLLLFAVPMLLIPISAGIAVVGKGPDRDRRLARGSCSWCSRPIPAIGAARNLVQPLQAEELRGVMRSVAGRPPCGGRDLPLLRLGAGLSVLFRVRRPSGLAGCLPIIGGNGRQDQSIYSRDLERLRGRGRVWFLFSHAIKEDERFFLEWLNARGRRLDGLRRSGLRRIFTTLAHSALAPPIREVHRRHRARGEPIEDVAGHGVVGTRRTALRTASRASAMRPRIRS